MKAKYSPISHAIAPVAPTARARSSTAANGTVRCIVNKTTAAASRPVFMKCIQSSNQPIASYRSSWLPRMSVKHVMVTRKSANHGNDARSFHHSIQQTGTVKASSGYNTARTSAPLSRR